MKIQKKTSKGEVRKGDSVGGWGGGGGGRRERLKQERGGGGRVGGKKGREVEGENELLSITATTEPAGVHELSPVAAHFNGLLLGASAPLLAISSTDSSDSDRPRRRSIYTALIKPSHLWPPGFILP